MSRGLIDQQRWSAVVTEHNRWGSSVPRLLLDKKLVAEAALVQALSDMYGMQAVNLDGGTIPNDVIDLVPVEDAEEYEVMPFRRDGRFLDVAMADPTRHDAIDHLRARTNLNIRTYVTGLHILHRAIARYYGRVIVGAYAVDPRVTSGMFLRGDVIDFESSRRMAATALTTEKPAVAKPSPTETKIAQLEQRLADQDKRINALEALLKRDEDVLRRLFGLLIDKRVTTREELTELLR